MKSKNCNVPEPSIEQVLYYLDKWDNLEDYRIQEEALDELYAGDYSTNKDLKKIIIKCSALNDFYSTNIFKIYPVALRILELDIDERLSKGDPTLVNEIATVIISNKTKNFYSFASKYCSRHNKYEFPIYDSYVDKVLRYFRKKDKFASFENDDLKKYLRFKEVILEFRKFYHLEQFNLKDLDKFLWLFGKDYFPKKYW